MYFISILVSLALLNADPPTGWMQDAIPYETIEECNTVMPVRKVEMEFYIHSTFRGMGEILKFECITEPEWIKRNVDLGHKIPEDFEPKTNS
jgi:hypothetical protein